MHVEEIREIVLKDQGLERSLVSVLAFVFP